MKKKIVLYFLLLVIFIISGCKSKECEKGIHGELEWIIVKDSTCTELGSKNQVCTKCNKIITTAVIHYKDHIEEVVDGVPATCLEDGYSSSKKCRICDTILEEAQPILSVGHSYILDEELSTSKVFVYKCEKCLDTYQEENKDKIICESNHTPSDWIETLPATCSMMGSAHKVCTVCDVELEIKSIEKKPHNETIVMGYEATCDKEGLSDGIKCSVCDYIIKEQQKLDKLEHDYRITNTVSPSAGKDGYIEYTCSNCNDSYQKKLSVGGNYDSTSPTVILLSDSEIVVTNDNGGVIVNENIIEINLAGEYDILGELSEGAIIVSLGEEDNATLNLRGITLTSSSTNPIHILSGNEIDISVKSDTVNYIYDKREAKTTDVVGGAIYSLIDMDIKGKGALYVSSTYNNGIASTKDLTIKNVTLEVNAVNNALKGNDSLMIESGIIKAISSSGDALKTENSDISSKGNQRGIITILDGVLDLYAACDGIDAAYDCVIEGGTINIYTEKYSSYSGDVTITSPSVIYLRISSRASGLNSVSKYSAMYVSEDDQVSWQSGAYTSANGKKYYKFELPSTAKYVKFFAYSAAQNQNQSTDYLYSTDQLTIPTTFDTYYVTNSSSLRMSGSWENFNSPSGGMGRPGGPGGGMQEGNPNSAVYSCKGIKADNSITINGGSINIKSHDDGIHTNSDVLLQNGKYGIATLTINGGIINVYSDDDGIHADGILNIKGGDVIISNSYEGVEGNYINFIDGTVQIKASDDGINAKTTLYFSGSTVYLDAGGDGIDSNGNIYMTDGVVLALGPTNGGNGVIDYGDWGSSFSFSGGLLVAIGRSGMNARPTGTSGNTVSATTTTAPTQNSYLTVTANGNVVAILKVTKANLNYQVFAYNNSSFPQAKIAVTTSTSLTLTNNLYYVAK